MFQKYFPFVGAWIWNAYHNNFGHGSASFLPGACPQGLASLSFSLCSGKRSDSLTMLFAELFATSPSAPFEPPVSAQSPKQRDLVSGECAWPARHRELD